MHSAAWASATWHSTAIAMSAAMNLISAPSVAYRFTIAKREALMVRRD
jgi:hypothetical protein